MNELRQRVSGRASIAFVIASTLAIAACGIRVPQSAVRAAAGGNSSGGGTGGQVAGGEAGGAGSDSGVASGAIGATSGGASSAGGLSGATSGGGTVSGAIGGSAASGGSTSGRGAGGGAVAGLGVHSGAANLSPIALGSVGEYSGPVGASLGAGLPMTQVVVKYINDNGGLNGHPIKLYQADDQSDPNKYVADVQQMVEQDHVVAFFAQMSPLTVNAGDAYLTSKHVPVIGGDSIHSDWYQSPNLFATGAGPTTLSVADSVFGIRLGKTVEGMAYCIEAEPCQAIDQGIHSPLEKSAAGAAHLVYEAQVSLAQPDYTSECLQAQSKGVQTFMIIVDANSIERFTHSCLQQGYHPQFVGISLALTNPILSDPDANGVGSAIASFPWMMDDIPAEHPYHAAIRQYDAGLQESASSSMVWLSGQLLLAASRNLPVNNVTSQDMYNGLYKIHDDTLGGLAPHPITFTPGQPSPDSSCYFFVQDINGQYQAPFGSKPQCL